MSASEQIAVDIVLLPPESVVDASIAINNRLVERTGNHEVVLDKQGMIPHITLAMGTVKWSDLAVLGRRLDEIVHQYLPLATAITELATVSSSRGDIVSGFNIWRTDDLQALHESVMTLLLAFDTGEVAASMIAGWGHEPIDAFTTEYIRDFPKQSAYANYSSHITLGYGDAREDFREFSFPLPFLCTSAAICHLGNFCTCKKVLAVHPEV